MIRKLWLGAVGVAMMSAAALGGVGTGMTVTAPVRPDFGGDVELVGPRSVLVLQVPPFQTNLNNMTVGQPISIGAMYGIAANGSLTTALVDLSFAIVSPPLYNNTTGNTVTIDLKLVASNVIESFFSPDSLDGFEPTPDDDVVAVQIRLTTGDRNLNTDGIELFYDDVSFSEDGDQTLTIDQTGPTIVAAYYEFPFFWVAFSERINSGQPSNDANHTVLAGIDGTDFQTSPLNVFTAATANAGTPFSPLSIVFPDTIQVQASPAINLNIQPGRFIRCRANDAGLPVNGVIPLHDVKDIAGNLAFQRASGETPGPAGVIIQAGSPPIFRQWLNPGAGDYGNAGSWAPGGVPGLNDTLRIDRSPSSVTVNTQGIISSSSRLWTGGPVTLNLGGLPSAARLSYTRTDEASLVVGYLNPGSLTCVNSTGGGAGFLDAEWTEVRAGGTLTSGNQANFSTGKMVVEGDGATAVAGFGSFFFTGNDNALGGVPPDFTTEIRNGGAVIVNWRWVTVGPATIGPNASLTCTGGNPNQRAEFFQGLTLGPSSLLNTQRLTVGDLSGIAGVSVAGPLTLRPPVSFSSLVEVNILPDARVNIEDYDGEGITMNVDGVATIGGTLNLAFAPGFNPAAGQSFTVLSSNFLSGRFAVHLLPGFSDERVATVVYEAIPALGPQPNTVTLSITTVENTTGLVEGQPTPLQGSPVAGDLGDLNGDGLPDLAVVLPDVNASLPGSVLILINEGDPDNNGVWNGFGPTIQLTVGRNPRSVAIGDFDPASPALDLAVANEGDDTVTVYSNAAGDATSFPLAATVPVGDGPVDVNTARFNADARDDLAVVCAGGDTVFILVNTGTLAEATVAFATASSPPTDDMPTDCDPVDLDNDKDLDVAVGTLGGDNVQYLINDGNGVFAAAGGGPAGDDPVFVATGSLDADLDAEIVTADNLSGTVTIFRNDNTTPGVVDITPTGSIPVGDDTRAVTLVDIDGDGLRDIAAVANDPVSGQRQIRVLRNNTVGANTSFTFAASAEFGGNGSVYLLTGDVNNDGRQDLVSIDDSSAAFALETGSDTGEKPPAEVSVFLNVSGPQPACAGDANGDASIDGNDLKMLLGKFGQAHPPQTGPNFNNDTTVNFADLTILLSRWNQTCGT